MKVILSNIKLEFTHDEEALFEAAANKLNIKEDKILDIEIAKKSIDARRKPKIFSVYSLLVNVKVKLTEKQLKRASATIFHYKEYELPTSPTQPQSSPVIVGAGPAGLFCGLVLARKGYKPIILERGEEASKRSKTIQQFIKSGQLDVNSNVTFGEGGAGTFSDGKLNTGVKDKYHRKAFILDTLIEHGADPSIRYMAKPHVGTDYLVQIVEGIRNEIIALGGEVRFGCRFIGFEEENNRIKAAKYRSTDHNVQNCQDDIKKIPTDQIVLAIGHSARDTFSDLFDQNVMMEAKAFAIGVRIEHPQEWINRSQYGDEYFKHALLPSAEYKLTHQCKNGKGVYTFCMCPGGYVVNASSEANGLVCNGMSLFARDNVNANSAVIATITPQEYAMKESDTSEIHPLAGVQFQRSYEEKAYCLTGSHALPTQTFDSFYKAVRKKQYNKSFDETYLNVEEVATTCESALKEADLTKCLPVAVCEAITEGIEAFGAKIKGFDHPKARLVGIETRTSSPVRIIRDERFMTNYTGLYPCGEGAGYAGGIMSAAIDGMKVAEQIIKNQ